MNEVGMESAEYTFQSVANPKSHTAVTSSNNLRCNFDGRQNEGPSGRSSISTYAAIKERELMEASRRLSQSLRRAQGMSDGDDGVRSSNYRVDSGDSRATDTVLRSNGQELSNVATDGRFRQSYRANSRG